jgi:hypothetical protein
MYYSFMSRPRVTLKSLYLILGTLFAWRKLSYVRQERQCAVPVRWKQIIFRKVCYQILVTAELARYYKGMKVAQDTTK